MVGNGCKNLKWDYESCKMEASKYGSRYEFQKGNQSAYKSAQRHGWLDDFFGYIKRCGGYWTFDRCLELSRKCRHITDLQKRFGGAYNSIIRNGWFDKMEFCEQPKTIDTEEFRKRVFEKHGDKFDTSISVYVSGKKKVEAICREHGKFSALPNSFFNGIACPGCIAEERKKKQLSNLDAFIEKFRSRFGDIYSFDKSVYVDAKTKMVVTCPIHGDFEQTPNKLLNGRKCHACEKEKVKKMKAVTQDEFMKRVLNVFGDAYDFSKAIYKSAKEHVTVICPVHGEFKQTPEMLYGGYGCPECSEQTSAPERELLNYIKDIVGEENVKHGDKELLEGREIDILIESCKLGIEYNGNYWHTEETGKDKTYHIGKTDVAEEKGYKLIQIFSDEYMEHKELVYDKISHALGCDTDKIKIGARKCVVREIGKDEARIFLDKFHMQGFAKSTEYYGAFYNNKLVGVMTFLKGKEGNWDMNRLSTDINYSIPGLPSKMFKHFLNSHDDVVEVKSFLDRRWGKDGDNVYNRMGFVLDKVEEPDYRYLVNDERVHKFNFRKNAINKKYGLPLTMSEREMMEELGIPRIWDCGLIKYVYHVKKS